MSINTINRYVYEVITYIKELPYDLSTGKESDKIKQSILDYFETVPRKYRHQVFKMLDEKGRSYDYTSYGLWQCYIRQIRNSGRGPLFQ